MLMTPLLERLVIPDGLSVASTSTFKTKLAGHRSVGASNLHMVFDFDRTLTVKKPGTDDEVTTWHILREHLPEEGQLQYQELFEKYRALEIAGTLTQEDAITWWSSILNLFVQYNVDLTAVEEDFLAKANIRPGVAELFKLCSDNKIPTIILSAGIRDVIEIWCRKYRIEPSLVISTGLILDKTNRIVGWGKETLVHALNKSEATHPELLAIRKSRPKALLVGDSLDDAAMAAGERDVIRIRLLDPRADDLVNEQEQKRTFERFDALIKSGSLLPACELVEAIIS